MLTAEFRGVIGERPVRQNPCLSDFAEGPLLIGPEVEHPVSLALVAERVHPYSGQGGRP